METRSNRRGLLLSYVSSQWPDVPAIFESLNDDTLTTILQFVGNKSYKSFGGINKHCKEVYLTTQGMTKETFVFGYASLSRVTDRIERSDMEDDLGLQLLVGAGVVLYNRRDVMDWAIEERKKHVLKGICILAVEEERFDLLEEIFNGVEDWDEKEDVFKGLDFSAASCGKLNVLKWLETHQLDIDKEKCALYAARYAQLQIIQWLREEKGLELDGRLYLNAADGGQLHVMKWLREQGCPWYEYTFQYAVQEGNLNVLQWLHDEGCPWGEFTFYQAAKDGNLDVLQWLHDEGCPWDRRLPVSVEDLKPEVIDWCRVNGYGDRISFV